MVNSTMVVWVLDRHSLCGLWEDFDGGGYEFVALVAMGLCRWWLWVYGVGGCEFVSVVAVDLLWV